MITDDIASISLLRKMCKDEPFVKDIVVFEVTKGLHFLALEGNCDMEQETFMFSSKYEWLEGHSKSIGDWIENPEKDTSLQYWKVWDTMDKMLYCPLDSKQKRVISMLRDMRQRHESLFNIYQPVFDKPIVHEYNLVFQIEQFVDVILEKVVLDASSDDREPNPSSDFSQLQETCSAIDSIKCLLLQVLDFSRVLRDKSESPAPIPSLKYGANEFYRKLFVHVNALSKQLLDETSTMTSLCDEKRRNMTDWLEMVKRDIDTLKIREFNEIAMMTLPIGNFSAGKVYQGKRSQKGEKAYFLYDAVKKKGVAVPLEWVKLTK